MKLKHINKGPISVYKYKYTGQMSESYIRYPCTKQLVKKDIMVQPLYKFICTVFYRK